MTEESIDSLFEPGGTAQRSRGLLPEIEISDMRIGPFGELMPTYLENSTTTAQSKSEEQRYRI